MDTIGSKIKYLRKSMDLSQPQLAKLMQVSNAVISFWENDINEPKANYIVKLTNIFNVSADYLLGIEEEDGRIIVEEGEVSDDERILLDNYRSLPPDIKTNCLDYIKTIKKLNSRFNSANKTNH